MSRLIRLSLASLLLLPLSVTAAWAVAPITFEDLKFEMKEGDKFERSMIDEKVEATIASPVKITGYLSPSFKQDGIDEFVLMRNTECKFGRDLPFHFVIVRLVKGQTTSYSVRPVTVEGSIRVEELTIDGKTFAVYMMDSAKLSR